MTKNRKRVYYYCFALIAAIVIAVVGPFRYGYSSVCSRCGCIRHTMERQLPLVHTAYWRTDSFEETPVSRLDIIPAHEHEWLFAHGGGNGGRGSGIGIILARSIKSEMVASFVASVDRFEGRAAAQQWLGRILKPGQSAGVRSWLELTSFPNEGFVSDGEYFAWRSRVKEWEYVWRDEKDRSSESHASVSG